SKRYAGCAIWARSGTTTAGPQSLGAIPRTATPPTSIFCRSFLQNTAREQRVVHLVAAAGCLKSSKQSEESASGVAGGTRPAERRESTEVNERYYQRAGTSSAVMPHAMLAALFGNPLWCFKTASSTRRARRSGQPRSPRCSLVLDQPLGRCHESRTHV